ncbi:MAG: DNA topoisomerase IV subunit B [Bacteroidales bacterium]|nr:DNA topoisomerase IV subunit B [Bacteroidales bacterium]
MAEEIEQEELLELEETESAAGNYTDDSIISLSWNEHIRTRPGMYIGKLGDGASQDDGIYVLLKEVIDNSIDEYVMGNGRNIEITIKDRVITVRDYGRGIPLGKLNDCVSKINTGGKYDSKAFQKSVGLNGVGTKAVNALSSWFRAQSVRDGKTKVVEYERGELKADFPEEKSDERNGTIISFIPDEQIFGNYHYRQEYVDKLLWNYAFLNVGLVITINNTKIQSKNGLLDLLNNNLDSTPLYPIIHIKEQDFEFAMTHVKQYAETYYSFVNGQHTTQGGTHQQAFREAVVKTIREFYNKEFDTNDIRTSLNAALSLKVQEPIFESQTKTKLGSTLMEKNGVSISKYIGDIVTKHLDNFLHKNPETAEVLLAKIQQSERERKEMADIRKNSKTVNKKLAITNEKLRDCRVHYNSSHERRLETTIFITEGNSATGSITKSRDANTQAVFSLRGKPENVLGKTKKEVYLNRELKLLDSALNIEDGLDGLRYNNVVIATDADVDGMHIRLLVTTFFLCFYPELIKKGHVYVLQTPLFRVRNKSKTKYCYSEEEKDSAIQSLGKNPEITRFKGLGEISPDEFKYFIGPNILLEPVVIGKDALIDYILNYYMGNNTPERQKFIIENLRIEEDVVEKSR